MCYNKIIINVNKEQVEKKSFIDLIIQTTASFRLCPESLYNTHSLVGYRKVQKNRSKIDNSSVKQINNSSHILN